MPHSDYTPQLATLVKAPPSGDEWLHEIKYDGYRIGCRIRGGRVALISRNGKDWTAAFPEIAAAAGELPVDDALLDGEVAMVLPDGRTSFQALQNAASGEATRGALVYFVFDLLRLDGERIASQPLDSRKTRLKTLVGRGKTGRIRYSDHVDGSGQSVFDQACRVGLEGIISKRRDQPHQPGRHGGWVKTKCIQRQEFVIGGFTDPEGSRVGIGALLIGFYDGSRLVFSGKVGTGFSHKLAVDLRKRLDAIGQKACPFDPPPPGALGRTAHWVRPDLVGEVEFTEWTSDGKIRHPSFQGIRADKKPREVVREREREARQAVAPITKRAAAKSGRRDRDGQPTPANGVVAGVRISHPERVLFPGPSITKLDLARYYERIADWIVPHVADRPLTLVRCPTGLGTAGRESGAGCFFMKHSKVWAPEPLRRVRIQEKKKVGEYLIADTIAAVVGLAQMDVLEIHTWNSGFMHVERPNRIVIDLDPGKQVAFAQIVQAARTVRKALEALDLESFVKTTGGRGLHVVVPLVPHADWAACLEFSRTLSEAIERTDPALYTTQFAKAGRDRRILLDYLRNNRTNTSIAAYSTRARREATVSVPLTWAELRPSLDPDTFTIATVPQRLSRLRADPWRGYWTSRQKLTARHLRALAIHD
jgi:bifunctional non-homologous end joining protein LigD